MVQIGIMLPSMIIGTPHDGKTPCKVASTKPKAVHRGQTRYSSLFPYRIANLQALTSVVRVGDI